jgi:hypothetical protein
MPQYALSNIIATLKVGSTTYADVVELTAPQISVTINEHTPFGGDGWVRKTASVKNVGNISASLVYSETLMGSLMLLLTPAGSGFQAQNAQSCELIFGAASAEGKFTFSAIIASLTPPPDGQANSDARIQLELAVDGAMVFVPGT